MKKILKSVSLITLIAMFSKLFGFAREMVIAAYYGASWQTDAYNMANSIIGLSTAILSLGVATVIVPMYNHKLVQSKKDAADDFASNILCITSLVYGAISLLGIVFAPFLINLFAPSFNGETAQLSLELLRILFLFTIGTNIINFLVAISHANKKFAVAASIGFPLSIASIVSIVLLSGQIGIFALVVSTIATIILQITMLVLSLKGVFKFKPALNFTNGDAKAVTLLCIPIFWSIGVNEINSVIDRILASGLVEGSISAIGYAQKLFGLPSGIISASILTVTYPLLSQNAAIKDFTMIKQLVSKTITLLYALLVPITLICVYYNKEIVKIVYERGAFTHNETMMTANIFIFVIISLFFAGGCGVLNNAFYGMQDTKTPRLGAVISVIFNIILNLILVRYMQAAGLVFATSISVAINYLLLLVFFRKKCGAFGGMALLMNICKCTVAITGMVPIFFLSESFRGMFPTLIFFGLAAMLCLLVYGVLLFLAYKILKFRI